MQDEVIVALQPRGRQILATVEGYPSLRGMGRTNEEALHALAADIHRKMGPRRAAPLVRQIEINLRMGG